MAFVFAQVNNAILQHTHFVSFYQNDAVAHHGSPGIKAQYHFFFFIFDNTNSHKYKVRSSLQTKVIYRQKAEWGIKWVILIAALSYVGFHFFQPDWKASMQLVGQHVFLWENSLLLLLILLLLPINWGVESLKWHLLCQQFEPVSRKEAFRMVLYGVSLGFWSSYSLADLAARTWHFKGKRGQAFAVVMVNRFAQAVPAFAGGIWAIIEGHLLPPHWTNLGFFWGATVALAFVIFLVARRFWWKYLKSSWRFMRSISFALFARVLGWSVLRYFVFSLQFFLMFQIFQVSLNPLLIFAGISWIFFVKSFVPSFHAVGDLGLREFSALLFFAPFGVSSQVVVCASLGIWCINILLPGLLGLLHFQSSSLSASE